MLLAQDDTDTALEVIAGLLLVLRLQHWPNIKLTLPKHEKKIIFKIEPIEYAINVYDYIDHKNHCLEPFY